MYDFFIVSSCFGYVKWQLLLIFKTVTMPISKTITLSFAPHGCVKSSVTVRKQHELHVLESKVHEGYSTLQRINKWTVKVLHKDL
jgi:hypothetical protein